MKTLTIIKAIGAGVTALYLGGKVANMARVTTTKTEVERQTAQQWHYAADEFLKALEELLPETKPHQPYHFNGAGRAMPVFHGSDES